MQFKAILTVSLLSAAQVAYAAPPPCLMAAVNTQPNPSDFKSICGDNASMVQKQIESVCKGDDLTAALASFADTCRTNGVAVPPVAPSSSTTSGTSSSSSSSGSGSASGTDIPTYTTTGASSGSVPVPVPGTSHGSTSATSTGKNGTHTTGTGTGTGTGSVGTSVPAATGGGTKTSGTSGSAAGSAKPSTTSGVAGRLAGSIGGLVMVAAGAILML